MLSNVYIHNFNCFVDFKLALPRRLLLVGSNGSGKTTLWEVLIGLQRLVAQSADIDSIFPSTTHTRWRHHDPTQRFAIEVSAGNDAYRYELDVEHDFDRRIASIRREHLSSGGQPLYEAIDGDVLLYGDKPSPTPRTRFPFNHKRSFLSDLEPRRDNKRITTFRDVLANMCLLAPSPQKLDPRTAEEAPFLDSNGSNFASWFKGALVERPELGQRLREALQPALPGLQKIGFEMLSRDVRELMLTFHTQGEAYKLSAGELSDGQRTLLLLYGLLVGALDRAAFVFLDEPEVGLAPHEMQPWFSAMSDALDAHGGQALVISHHPGIIDYVAPAGTVRFSRPGGGAAQAEEVTLETTNGLRVSEWISRPWAYEGEHDEPAP